jgi:hypothetical protein
MKLKSKSIAPIVLAAFVVGIGGTMAFNLWRTESSKVPATYASGEFAGQYDPGDIRGSYSFTDIEKAFDVPVADLARAFGVDSASGPTVFQCKELEDMYAGVEQGEIGTDSVRWFVALYNGLPFTPEDDTLLPNPAVSLLKNEGRLSDEQLAAVREKAISLEGLAAAVAEGARDDEQETEERQVRGMTTFQELLSWGVSREEFEELTGLPMGSTNMAMRDYFADQGVEFSSFKDKIQELVLSKQQ